MATKRQVERKLRELIKRLEESGSGVRSSLAGALPESRIIEVAVSDLGVSYWTELADGAMSSLHEGVPDQHEIRIRVSSDDLEVPLLGLRRRAGQDRRELQRPAPPAQTGMKRPAGGRLNP
ncbi:MAG: hypothetical protein E6G40_09905 [Actinobacteria bacterium]|nr:MAG: hypothetical protein E6G40_09905 [Actinomycetota bacterium]